MNHYIFILLILYTINNVKSVDEDNGFSYRFDLSSKIKRKDFLPSDIKFIKNIDGIEMARHHIISHSILWKFYASMTKTKVRQLALVEILNKLKKIRKNILDNKDIVSESDIDNLIACLEDININNANNKDQEINICTNLLNKIYILIVDAFNIFVGPRERSFDLGQSLDVEGRALLPDDLIISLTNVYHTMVIINDNQEVSESEINTLRDDLITLLDYDLESQGFDSGLWIEQQNQIEIASKNGLLFFNILKKVIILHRELLTFRRKKIPLNKIKEIKSQISHVFDLFFNLIDENPELLEKYGDRLLRNALSIDLNEFLQEILTIDPNLFIYISSVNNRNYNQNNIKVVYKLSKYKINNAHRILMCNLLNQVNAKIIYNI
ncbi:hypothetical protein CHREV_089 [Choristoneura rosaceana entomopoxvirus 'L']|uniref:Uncharacterized protein n=1 Tax=Choristoneura rosaceana entomopoxvirus 'L' TaxID=1293539 RepID=A0ABM9QKC8_9POXV|nr:hypothetical protein CHREV_089 [Choristoneura rosaceana entomopoxvirus 'L']CCU55991.1 hypothetical protein CHREV_089 [Choristoneura rosaceana entomopoxvirus 'L']